VPVIHTRNAPSSDLVFHIDAPRHGVVVNNTENLHLAGWVVSEREPIREIRIYSHDRLLEKAGQTIRRSRVQGLFPDHLHSEKAGFALALDARGVSTLVVKALLENGEERWLATLSLVGQEKVDQSTKQLLYVHVAKTAGTSLNNFIASHFAAGDFTVHLENVPEWKKSRSIARQRFVSGHLRYEELKKHLDTGPFVKVVTFRPPIEQVISHLAWVRHFSDPGFEAELDRHPEYIRLLSQKLVEIDLSSPARISHLIENLNDRELALLDNSQTRYLCGEGLGRLVTENDLASARENLKEFDAIGTTEDLGKLIARICSLMGWELPGSEPRDNVQSEKYGLDSTNPEIGSALQPLIAHDRALYKHVTEHYK
jgi:hypothetical protein